MLQQSELLEHKRALRTAVTLRAPYVDALSRLQLRALTELHVGQPDGQAQTREVREEWGRLLLLAVNGAAAGLQNTG